MKLRNAVGLCEAPASRSLLEQYGLHEKVFKDERSCSGIIFMQLNPVFDGVDIFNMLWQIQPCGYLNSMGSGIMGGGKCGLVKWCLAE